MFLLQVELTKEEDLGFTDKFRLPFSFLLARPASPNNSFHKTQRSNSTHLMGSSLYLYLWKTVELFLFTFQSITQPSTCCFSGRVSILFVGSWDDCLSDPHLLYEPFEVRVHVFLILYLTKC